MTLPGQDGTERWIGRTVVDRDGAEIGVCTALLTDTSTGLPEWLSVDRDESTVIVPLLDAKESGDRVQVTVSRAYADGAPRFAPAQELTRDQEAALYRHYGIEYSDATSDSLLPADAQPADAGAAGAEDAGSAPAAAVRPFAGGAGPGVAAAVAAVLGVVAAVVAVVRLRRAAPPPRPAARPVVALPPAARARAVQAAAAARPLLDTAGQAAWQAVRAGTDSALRITDAATEAVAAAVPRIAESAARAGRGGLRAVLTVGAAAEAVPDVVAGTGRQLEKGWRRTMSKLSLGLGFGIGYVLGARAGRTRYAQIKQAAAGFVQRPEVRNVLDKARTAAPAPLRSSIDTLSGGASGGQGTAAGTVGVGATPAPPVADPAGPSPTGAPLRDPLVPPAKSADGPTAQP